MRAGLFEVKEEEEEEKEWIMGLENSVEVPDPKMYHRHHHPTPRVTWCFIMARFSFLHRYSQHKLGSCSFLSIFSPKIYQPTPAQPTIVTT